MQEPAFITIPLQTLEDLLHEVQELRDQIKVLEERQAEDEERFALDIAQDRRRITALEHQEPEPKEYTSKVAEHLNDIYDALEDREKQCKNTGQKWDYIAFWEVEELLGLSRARVSQLADIAKDDPRFVIGWHHKRKNMKIIKLNPFRSIGHAAALMIELSKKSNPKSINL